MPAIKFYKYPHIIDGDKIIYFCVECGYMTNNDFGMYRHKKAVHEKTKDCKCTMCDYAGVLDSYLYRHIKNVHKKIKDYECDICDYKCISNRDLKRHMMAKH